MNVPRISDTIARNLEQRILEGSLRPGDRLPPERELAEQMGVSRPSLREGLRKLASKGLISSRQGGGHYVTDVLQASFVEPWKEMISQHPALEQDLLEVRHILEGQAAELASERANDFDIRHIDAAFEKLEAAFESGELPECIKTDVDFHQAIAEASHNALIAHLSASLHRLIHDQVEQNLRYLQGRPQQWARLQTQHRAIWEKVRTRNARDAATAARQHLAYVQQSMGERALEAERIESAKRRTRKPV